MIILSVLAYVFLFYGLSMIPNYYLYGSFYVLMDTPETYLLLFFIEIAFVAIDVGNLKTSRYLKEKYANKFERREARKSTIMRTVE